MNKTLFAATAAIAALFALPASALDWTVRAEVGQTVNTQIDFGPITLEPSNGSVVGIHVGADLGSVTVYGGVRQIELEALASAVTIDATNITAGVRYDLPYGLFVEGGGDYYYTETTIGGVFSVDNNGWGLHGGFGYAHRITDSVDLEVAYRYTDSSDLGFTSGAVTAGVSFTL